METAKVSSIPNCQICLSQKATVDGKTEFGPWAFMCDGCHEVHGRGFGMGRGQRLVLDGCGK